MANPAPSAQPDRDEDALAAAWRLAYLDPPRARAAAQAALGLAAADSVEAGWAHWHIGLADVRTAGDHDIAASNARACRLFEQHGIARGLLLCNEVEAIRLRRLGDLQGALALHIRADSAQRVEPPPFDRYLAHNSRAITNKLLGQSDIALSNFYAALEAAQQSGDDALIINALANLGGFHQDLFNLEDARELSEQALTTARKLGAKPVVTVAGANLLMLYFALGQPAKALEMARFLESHPDEQLPDALARVSLPLALAYLANGDIQSAETWLSQGATAAVSDGDGVVFWAWLSTRTRLARGDAAAARQVAETVLVPRAGSTALPYESMELLRAAADACQALGDPTAALAYTQQAHSLYELLVGRSARARYRALQAHHDYTQAQRERDLAQQLRREADIDRKRLAALNQQLETKIAETEALHARLREQAVRDPLTGLHNRRYLFEAGPGLIELARRQGKELSLVLLDLDHFKLVNDTLGHAAGDQMLCDFSQLLAAHVRRSDLLCRIGGEEFVIVMPDVELSAAIQSTRRLLDAFRALPMRHRGQKMPCASFSGGVAMFPEHGDTIERLLGLADKALYAAKESGRGRVEPVTSAFSTFT